MEKLIYVLPGTIVKAVDSLLKAKTITGKQRNYAIKVVGSMWLKYYSKGERIPLLEYSSFAWSYYQSILNIPDSEQKKLLDLLRKENIIQWWNDGHYLEPKNGKKGVCRKWRINPDLVYGSESLEIVEIKQKLKRNRKRKSLVEIEAREHLRKIKLPWQTRDQIKDFVSGFIKSDQIQARITERIEEVQQIPSKAFLLLDDTNNYTTLEKDAIKPYLDCGLKIYRYHGKGRVSHFISTYQKVKTHKEKELQLAFEYQLYILNQVDQAGASSCNRNDTNNRLDSPLTNLFSKFLALATVDGEKLTSIDLSNSQFVFLARRIQNWLDEKRPFFLTKRSHCGRKNILEDFKEYIKRKEQEKPKRANNKTNKRTLISYSTLVTPQLTDNEIIKSIFNNLQLFINICFSGQLYERVASRVFLSKNYDDCSLQEKKIIASTHRQRAKQMLFELLFDKYNAHAFKDDRKRNRDLLMNVFPALVHWVDYWKEMKIEEFKKEREDNPRRWNELHKKNGKVLSPFQAGNNAFAVMLQRDEAFLFIDKILRKLQKKNVWCASKHDSILTTESNYQRVLKLMCVELDKAFGAGNYRLKKESYHWDGSTTIETASEPIELNLSPQSVEAPKEPNTPKVNKKPVQVKKPANGVQNNTAFKAAMDFLSQKRYDNIISMTNAPGSVKIKVVRTWLIQHRTFDPAEQEHRTRLSAKYIVAMTEYSKRSR